MSMGISLFVDFLQEEEEEEKMEENYHICLSVRPFFFILFWDMSEH
jgi:hypothetical protein